MNIEIHPTFKFDDIVKTILDYKGDPERYRVVSFQINIDSTISYGCTDIKGDWHWFKAYEIELVTPEEPIGYSITLKV